MKPIIAKLTRPRIEGIVGRRRLFTRLDALAGKKIIWISAPAGSGKTTLVASWLDARKIPCIWYQADEGDSDLATFFSYLGTAVKHAAPRFRTPLPLLTREYLSGVSIFTTRYFETLFSRLKSPFCLVIDNYQDVPPESKFHEAVRDGLSMAPDGITIIIVSRSDPPSALSRYRVSGDLELLKREDIWFTFEESRALVSAFIKKKPSDEILKALFQKTAGWAAGLILLTTRAAMGSDFDASEHVSSDLIFDYFAAEVFERTDYDDRTFLLKTAFLPIVTVRAAQAITDNIQSEQILRRLSRTNFFTDRLATAESPAYQYHPLFRDFLLNKARDHFDPDEIVRFKKKAAMLLEAEDQIEEAAKLLIEAEDWQALTDFILRHAPGFMSMGRFRTIEAWIGCIPGQVVEQNSWLLYWKASCRISAKPAEARNMLERAYTLSLDEHDPTGSFLFWTGIVNTFVYEWRDFHPLDQWIAAFEKLRRKYRSFPSPEVGERATSAIFTAMMFRQPDHPDLAHWTSRAQSVMQSTRDSIRRMFVGSSLILYYLWTGRIAEAGALVSLLSPVIKTEYREPLPKLMWYRSVALHDFYVSQTESGLDAVKQGLGLAEETGIHHMDLMFCGVAIYHATVRGDLDLARNYLERMASLRDRGSCYAEIYYTCQSSLVALLRGELDTAVVQAEVSVRLTDEAGVPLILNGNQAALAFVLMEARQNEKIGQKIAELRSRAAKTGSVHIEAWCSCIEALLALRDGNDALFADSFNKAVNVCKKTGLRLLTFLPTTLARICSKALDLDIETDFAKELIRLNRLVPDPGAVSVSWPYPLKVYTLGRFELLRDEKPVVFPGKKQQKPLTLLKALIAFGGKSVDEAQLVDALWSEAEGDTGSRNLDTTLHRLRKHLGDDEAVLLQEGRVSLNNKRVWTDAWGFERLLSRVEDRWKQRGRGHEAAAIDPACPKSTINPPQPDLEETIWLTEKALALYPGHFLSGAAHEPWAVSLRERLRSKFLHYTKTLGKYWQQSGRYDLAVECYRRGIEIDDLAEELYQQLMICHHKLGQEVEVVKTYYRCRSVLHNAFGLEPSTKIKEIYSSIRHNG